MDVEKPEYGAITIDTSIFDKYARKLESGLLRKLRQFKNSDVKLILSDMIVKELKAHIEKDIKGAREKVEAGVKASMDCLVLDPEIARKAKEELLGKGDISEIAEKRVSNFLSAGSAQVIGIKENLDIDRLIKAYFSGVAPFSPEEKKKHEFPDAIALYSLEKWAESNDIKVLAVSIDGDWEKFCESSKMISVEKDLGEALSLFQPYQFATAAAQKIANALLGKIKSDIPEKIEALLEKEVDDVGIPVEADSDFEYDSDLESVTFLSFVPLLDQSGQPIIRAIEVDKNQVTLECRINYDIEAVCGFDFTVYDSLDKEDIYIGSSTVSKKFTFQSGILITGEFLDEEDLSSFKISELELAEFIDEFYFDYIRPNYDDDPD